MCAGCLGSCGVVSSTASGMKVAVGVSHVVQRPRFCRSYAQERWSLPLSWTSSQAALLHLPHGVGWGGAASIDPRAAAAWCRCAEPARRGCRWMRRTFSPP
jgi:hypothetical protein